MKKTFVTLAFSLMAGFAIAAPAFADEPQRVQFTHEGVSYSYTLSKVGKSTVIDGRATPGTNFHLIVREGHVTGRINDMQVSYDVPSADVQAATARQVRVASR